MSFLSRIKGKIKGRIKDVRALVNIIHNEAKHPGRPQPHMAARNPLYGGVEEEQASKKTSPPPKEDIVEKEDFWYLRGDNEGWSDPNPGKKDN